MKKIMTQKTKRTTHVILRNGNHGQGTTRKLTVMKNARVNAAGAIPALQYHHRPGVTNVLQYLHNHHLPRPHHPNNPPQRLSVVDYSNYDELMKQSSISTTISGHATRSLFPLSCTRSPQNLAEKTTTSSGWRSSESRHSN